VTTAALGAVVVALAFPHVVPRVAATRAFVMIEEHHTTPASTNADFIVLVLHSSQNPRS
jgi:hypothetical protein